MNHPYTKQFLHNPSHILSQSNLQTTMKASSTAFLYVLFSQASAESISQSHLRRHRRATSNHSPDPSAATKKHTTARMLKKEKKSNEERGDAADERKKTREEKKAAKKLKGQTEEKQAEMANMLSMSVPALVQNDFDFGRFNIPSEFTESSMSMQNDEVAPPVPEPADVITSLAPTSKPTPSPTARATKAEKENPATAVVDAPLMQNTFNIGNGKPSSSTQTEDGLKSKQKGSKAPKK